jgi:hypothetical protein
MLKNELRDRSLAYDVISQLLRGISSYVRPYSTYSSAQNLFSHGLYLSFKRKVVKVYNFIYH